MKILSLCSHSLYIYYLMSVGHLSHEREHFAYYYDTLDKRQSWVAVPRSYTKSNHSITQRLYMLLINVLRHSNFWRKVRSRSIASRPNVGIKGMEQRYSTMSHHRRSIPDGIWISERIGLEVSRRSTTLFGLCMCTLPQIWDSAWDKPKTSPCTTRKYHVSWSARGHHKKGIIIGAFPSIQIGHSGLTGNLLCFLQVEFSI